MLRAPSTSRAHMALAIGTMAWAGATCRCHAAEPGVLLTAFGPFAGRGVHGSATVAHRLDGTLVAGALIHILVVPVRWGEPERLVPAEVDRLKPVALLGLGEGLPGHAVYVECVGHNAARALPDADGALPAQAILDATAPSSRPARFHVDPAWFTDAAFQVTESHDAGGYRCHEMFFTALGQAVRTCGFVHLPPQGEVPDDAYCEHLVPIVRALLAHNRDP
jgi:pyrrolidone-carboxylate peptidase